MGKVRTKAQTGRFSRQKGKRYERMIAHRFNAWAGLRNDRNIDETFTRRWSGRAETPKGGDLKLPASGWFPLPIECRDRMDWSLENLIEKGMESTLFKWWLELSKKNDAPYLLVFSQKYRQDYVMFDNAASHELGLGMFTLAEGEAFISIGGNWRVCLLDSLFIRVKPEDLKKKLESSHEIAKGPSTAQDNL